MSLSMHRYACMPLPRPPIQTVVGGSFYNSITNPGLLPESAHAADSPLLVSSCEIVEAMTRRHPPPTGNVTSPSAWDRALWESVEPFCDPGWPESEAARREPGGAASGSAAIAMPALRSSVLSWVDEAFVGAQARLYDEDGWLPRGFMTYFAGPPTGKHAKMVEMLITSVHEFSVSTMTSSAARARCSPVGCSLCSQFVCLGMHAIRPRARAPLRPDPHAP